MAGGAVFICLQVRFASRALSDGVRPAFDNRSENARSTVCPQYPCGTRPGKKDFYRYPEFPFIKTKSSESSDEAMTIILTGHPEDVPDLFRDLFLFQGPN
ncbi:hypothetical protein A8C56_01415 [Niabella ginsenosidivorans]|uniref:Uncharacterized protein n=1 Tax=Niabella ginsenosidivorans TaxID=1176587 RepID=A0A1A9HWM6_9BACT|nr:hypothetical protein A8C56_01415 [Niabella ginsenosidivorans]